jgi:hypothetical protein
MLDAVRPRLYSGYMDMMELAGREAQIWQNPAEHISVYVSSEDGIAHPTPEIAQEWEEKKREIAAIRGLLHENICRYVPLGNGAEPIGSYPYPNGEAQQKQWEQAHAVCDGFANGLLQRVREDYTRSHWYEMSQPAGGDEYEIQTVTESLTSSLNRATEFGTKWSSAVSGAAVGFYARPVKAEDFRFADPANPQRGRIIYPAVTFGLSASFMPGNPDISKPLYEPSISAAPKYAEKIVRQQLEEKIRVSLDHLIGSQLLQPLVYASREQRVRHPENGQEIFCFEVDISTSQLNMEAIYAHAPSNAPGTDEARRWTGFESRRRGKSDNNDVALA